MMEKWVDDWERGIKNRIQNNNIAGIEKLIANLIAHSNKTSELISAEIELRSRLKPLQVEPALRALEVLASNARAAGPNELAKALGY